MSDSNAILLRALQETAGTAIVLDPELRVVAFTSDAPDVVGGTIPVGIFAPRVLCGAGPQRPVADALAAGRPVLAEVRRPSASGANRMVRVRALPLREEGGEIGGWLLLLSLEAWEVSAADERVEFWGMLTRDAKMKQLLRQVTKVAKTTANVLVRGETGSGKELVASAIHQASGRASGPFRAINCAALPATLLESELFGHVRGAFTGAVRDAAGHFRLANKGTLFLDEVGELPLEVQAKLLRVLQERRVIPVGGREPVEVDVRIVAATHRSLRQAVAAGEFRADLMYRLRVIPLFLPPLRERVADIELLAWHFIDRLRGEFGREVQRVTPGALKCLQNYEWPGNVRELQNAVEYALVMGEGPVLSEADLPPELRGEEPAYQEVNVGPQLPDALPPEARRLVDALERAGGHQGRAAASLGMSRVTLWRRLRKYGLDRAAQQIDGETD